MYFYVWRSIFTRCCGDNTCHRDKLPTMNIKHHNNPRQLQIANEALREKEAQASERCRREVAGALRLRDQERDRAAEESALRSDLESELQRIRAELEESRAGRDEARANLGVVAAACREADAKSRELQEHRRVLAREVRSKGAWCGVMCGLCC